MLFAFNSYANQFDISGNTIHYRVSNLANAQGWGGHVSTGSNEDGYGGRKAECYLHAKPANVVVFCYDGFDGQGTLNNKYQNQYRLDLGPQKDEEGRDILLGVMFKIYSDKIEVSAKRAATNRYDAQRVFYEVKGIFPLRESSGFFNSSVGYYKANGVLSGRNGREGSGFNMQPPISY